MIAARARRNEHKRARRAELADTPAAATARARRNKRDREHRADLAASPVAATTAKAKRNERDRARYRKHKVDLAAIPVAAATAKARRNKRDRQHRADLTGTPAAAAARAKCNERDRARYRKQKVDLAAGPAAATQARARRNAQNRQHYAQAAAAVDPDALAATANAACRQRVEAERQSNEQEAFDLIVRPKHQPVNTPSVEDTVVRDLQVAKDFQTYMDPTFPPSVTIIPQDMQRPCRLKGLPHVGNRSSCSSNRTFRGCKHSSMCSSRPSPFDSFSFIMITSSPRRAYEHGRHGLLDKV